MRANSLRRGLWVAAILGLVTSASAQTQLPGNGIDVSVGPAGDFWKIGADQSISYWNGANWTVVPGAATRIDVGPAGPWVVNAAGGVFRWLGAPTYWQQIAAPAALDVGVGADGTVWITATDQRILRFNGSSFVQVPGAAVKVDVDPTGKAWVITSGNGIFRWNGSSFINVPGAATEVTATSSGVVYVVGNVNDGTGNYPIFKWDGGASWRPLLGTVRTLAGDGSGPVFATRADTAVYYGIVGTGRVGCGLNQTNGAATTNWPGAGGTSAPPLSYSGGGVCSYTWGSSFMPLAPNAYVADDYSIHAFPQTQLSAVIGGLCAGADGVANGVPYRVLRPDQLGAIEPNSQRVQIIEGAQFTNSIVTIILPPNWTATPAVRYPIVFQSFYDVNDNLWSGSAAAAYGFGEGRGIARMIAKSGVDGHSGAIGVIWNGGGSYSGNLTNTYRGKFNEIIQAMTTYFGGDPYKILMFGGSRGGASTLVAASNQDRYPYKVVFAYAGVPATAFGTHLRLISPTNPQQAGFGYTGFSNAWQQGWTYNAGCPGSQTTYHGKSAKQLSAQLIFGSDYDPNNPGPWETAINAQSPVSTAAISGLLLAPQGLQTELVLEFGTHDPYIPYATEIDYYEKLRGAGVHVEAIVNIRGGHYWNATAAEARVWNALRTFIDPSVVPSLRSVTPGIRYTVPQPTGTYAPDGRPNAVPVAFTPPSGTHPFTLDIPRQQFAGQPITFIASGQPGTTYHVYSGTTFLLARTIPTGQWIDWTDLPAFNATGTFPITVYVLKPGATSFVVFSKTPTSNNEAPSITLGTPDPNWTDATAINYYLKGYAGAWGVLSETGWGVSEY